MINEVEKVWGRELWIVNEDEYCSKILEINPGFHGSLHYHKNKKETFHVLEGTVRLKQLDVRGNLIDETLSSGQTRTLYPRTGHEFSSYVGARILEISTHHDDSDTFRLTEAGKL